MTQEFKEWDHAFPQERIEATRAIWRSNYKRQNQKLYDIEAGHKNAKVELPFFWIYQSWYETDYTREQIADAVYTSSKPEEWQLFRVAMKGLSTPEKLSFLEARWKQLVERDLFETAHIERIRINNYIGALRRGGFLNDKFDVVK